VLRARRAAGRLPETVVVQFGNNGMMTAEQFDATMQALRDVNRVVWVDVAVPRYWESNNNKVIEAGVARHPNARHVRWRAATQSRPELFAEDGYHPFKEGVTLFARLVADQIR
jgi:hypothetical protein